MNALAEQLGYKKKNKIQQLKLDNWLCLGQIYKDPGYVHLPEVAMKVKFAVSKQERQNACGKIYIITCDDKIVKIGGSQTKGGIEGTINAYLGGFREGNSKRTYAVWNYINQQVKAGKTIEVYYYNLPQVRVEIQKMNGDYQQHYISVDYHTIEKSYVDEYKLLNGNYPYLNVQESNTKWEDLGLSEGWPGMGA
mgnify:FL=1